VEVGEASLFVRLSTKTCNVRIWSDRMNQLGSLSATSAGNSICFDTKVYTAFQY